MRHLVICFCLALVLLTGCAKKTEQVVVIASKPVTEQFILAEMLTLLI